VTDSEKTFTDSLREAKLEEKDRWDKLRRRKTGGQTGRQEGRRFGEALGGHSAANQRDTETGVCHMQ